MSNLLIVNGYCERNNNPCMNQGVCTSDANNPLGYTCGCICMSFCLYTTNLFALFISILLLFYFPAPYIGVNCSYTVAVSANSSCNNNLCQNNSTCVADTATSYICLCPSAVNIPGQPVQIGYTGVYCQIAQTACNPNPCLNGGLCYTLSSGNNYCFCTG